MGSGSGLAMLSFSNSSLLFDTFLKKSSTAPIPTPLVRECASSDTILVQVNPVERPGTPRSAREIIDRLNEVSFNSPLLKELRLIAVLRQVSNPGDCEGARWADMRIHRIASPLMLDLGYSSKLNGEWDFLTMLRDEGR